MVQKNGPSKIEPFSAETNISELKKLSQTVKHNYMIRKTNSGYNKIADLKVHPLTSIGLAMWMSPDFGSEVKDVFLKFIQGDVALIQQTISNLNQKTGLINNITTTTNPDIKEVSLLLESYEEDDYIVKIKDDILRKKIFELFQRQKGIIVEQKGEIAELKADIKKLLEYAKDTSNELKGTRNELKGTRNDLRQTNKKLDTVLPQRVAIENTDPDYPHVYILRDKDCNVDDPDLYVMRCQKSTFKKQFKQLKRKYGNNIGISIIIKEPNAIAFWKSIKKEYGHNMQFDAKTNWFSLCDITRAEFKQKIREKDAERQSK